MGRVAEQKKIEESIAVIKNIAPHLRRHDGGNRPGHKHNRAQPTASAKRLVQHQCHRGAEYHLDGRGYGDDGPLFTPQNQGMRNRDVLIEKGNVFIVKPIARSADGSFDTSWGGCVLVTDKGGEPLAKRTPGMVSIT